MKYLNLSGLSYFTNKIKSAVADALDGKSDVGHTHTKSEITDFPALSTVATSGDYDDLSNKPTIPIVDSALSSTSTNALQNKVINTELSKKADTSHTHTVSDVTDFPTLATVATSGSYNDLSNKPTTMTPASHTHGNITNDGKIGSNANKPLITTTGGTVTTGSFGTSANTFCEGNDSRLSDARTPISHTHTVSDVTDFPSLATVATSGSYNDLSNKPTIPTVNNATLTIQKNGTTVKTFTANASSNVTADITVPTKVSELTNDSGFLASVPNIDASKITSGTIDIARLPQGALERLVTVTNRTARFALTTSTVQVGDVVKQTDTGVMYYVVDTANLNSEDGYSEFTAGSATSVPWSGVTGKPSSYTPSSHTHGNITNAGAVGTTANKPLITTTNGVITTGSFGTTANTFCQGNDSRLSDARTPTAHTHSASDITSGLATVATSGSYNDLSNKPTIPTVNNATLTIQKNGTTVKTFTANASSNVTANITVPTKTSDLTNDSHVSITTETDTTSTGTPAHGGTFTCIDSVTRDSNGHVTKVNTKTVTLPSDSNTDTLVTQNVSTANENHPILLSVTKDATTNQGAKTSIFASGVKVNPSTGTVTATTFSGALSGNASTATQFSANKAVTLTGDVTGTASSKAGWSVATTLANSGVTAGTYGPSADVTGNNNATISVPEITVDAKGRVTSVTNRTLTCKNNTYNVYNKTLTIQKNGTNVATFTSNSNTDVTANISVPTKTSDLTNDSGFLTLESLGANSIPFHNAYPRCKYLGTSITDAQNTAIKNRTYDDLFVGDYWTINGINWRIVAIDYYYNVGDTNFDKGNIIVMPDTVLYNAQMNETNTTAGGYAGSLMRTQNLNNARTIARNAFGSHLANHRIVLTNSVDTSGPSSWAWYDSDGIELPNEVQIYGTRVWGSALKGYDVATQKQQFPLMALAPQFVNTRQYYWLQDVSSVSFSSNFAIVFYDGYVGSYYASFSFGVRPSVTLSYI